MKLITRLSKTFFVLAGAALVAACTSDPPAPSYPPIRFNDGTVLRLNVAEIDIVQAYKAPLKAPNAEHLFPVPPADAAAQWAKDRLRAAGASGRAEAVIENASVIETKLKRTGGIRGAFTTDQTERYDAELKVTVRILDADGTERARASSTARRHRTMPEDATVNEREGQWYRMTRLLMTTIDESLVRQINQSLSGFLR